MKTSWRRWQIERMWQACKHELAFESPCLHDWEHHRRLLMLACLAYAFLLELMRPHGKARGTGSCTSGTVASVPGPVKPSCLSPTYAPLSANSGRLFLRPSFFQGALPLPLRSASYKIRDENAGSLRNDEMIHSAGSRDRLCKERRRSCPVRVHRDQDRLRISPRRPRDGGQPTPE